MSIINDMIRYETNPNAPADGRRVIKDERMQLQSAIRRRSPEVPVMASEARRVLGMWQEVA